MASLFNENIPATASAIQSGELRDNFNALYDKVKTLEVRAAAPESTSVIIQGGPVYFRDGSLNTLKYIKFPTTEFNFLNNRGYVSLRDSYGTIIRELSPTLKGPSPVGNLRYLEVLISLRSNGQLIFTEATNAQPNPLSSPFNIFYGDDEIPVALVFLDINSAGILQPIKQTDITDVRPFITTAFQNNIQIATLEETVEDHTSRIEALEPSTKVADNLLVRILPLEKRVADGTTTSNTLIEIVSGSTITPDGYLVRYAGGYVDFAWLASGDSDKRILDAATDLAAVPSNRFNRALISIGYNSLSTDPTDNATISITHAPGIGVADPRPPTGLNTLNPTIPTNHIPLAYVAYQVASSGIAIVPFISEEVLGTTRLVWEFPITNLTTSSIEVDMSSYTGDPLDITGRYYQVGESVEIYDSNSRPLRRKIGSSTYTEGTKKLAIVVNDTFTGISLKRNPLARSAKNNSPIVEDLRPFIGR